MAIKQCVCGGTYGSAPSAMNRHFQSRKHLEFMVATGKLKPSVLGEPELASVEGATVTEGPEDLGIGGGLAVAHPGTPEAEDWTVPAYTPVVCDHKPLEDRQAVEMAKKAIKDIEAGIRWRTTRNPELVPKWEQKLADMQATLAECEQRLADHEAEQEANSQVRQAAKRDFWERVEQRIVPQVGGRSENSDLYFRGVGRGTYTVMLTTGKVLSTDVDGETIEYPETVWGYEASVHGPEETFTVGEDGSLNMKHRPAYVSWGGLGGTRTTAQNRQLIHVYEAALELCDLLNALLGLDGAA